LDDAGVHRVDGDAAAGEATRERPGEQHIVLGGAAGGRPQASVVDQHVEAIVAGREAGREAADAGLAGEV